MKKIRAIYERGVFIPIQPVELPEASEVELEARPVSDDLAVHEKLSKISKIVGYRYKTGDNDTPQPSP